MRFASWIAAAACAIGFVLLGGAVAFSPPGGADLAAASATLGEATPAAAALTALGRFPAYATLCALCVAAGVARRAWLGRAVAATALLTGAWIASDSVKLVYARRRPEHWLVTHETSASYPSGHATLSLVFYGWWAYVAVRSMPPGPARTATVAALGALPLAIGWSRLALGAHWLTDVAGGYLFGGAILAAAVGAFGRRAVATNVAGTGVTVVVRGARG